MAIRSNGGRTIFLSRNQTKKMSEHL